MERSRASQTAVTVSEVPESELGTCTTQWEFIRVAIALMEPACIRSEKSRTILPPPAGFRHLRIRASLGSDPVAKRAAIPALPNFAASATGAASTPVGISSTTRAYHLDSSGAAGEIAITAGP